MTSTAMMWTLCAAYLVIATCAATERNWPRVGYFVSAAGITVSVIYGSKQ